MIQAICQTYWDSIFFGYFFFGFIGPLVSVITIYFIRNRIRSRFWLKSLSIFSMLNLSSCIASAKVHFGCQRLLFGEIDTSPGDVGIIMLTLPLFLVCASLALISFRFIKRSAIRDLSV